MAKYSMKVKGKEIGPAEVYAPPHDMKGVSGTDISNSGYVVRKGSNANDVNMSVGNIYRNAAPAPKTDGIQMRGTGAATKGKMSRGPMA